MSESPQDSEWWLASDGKYYPPQSAPRDSVQPGVATAPAQATRSGQVKPIYRRPWFWLVSVFAVVGVGLLAGGSGEDDEQALGTGDNSDVGQEGQDVVASTEASPDQSGNQVLISDSFRVSTERGMEYEVAFEVGIPEPEAKEVTPADSEFFVTASADFTITNLTDEFAADVDPERLSLKLFFPAINGLAESFDSGTRGLGPELQTWLGCEGGFFTNDRARLDPGESFSCSRTLRLGSSLILEAETVPTSDVPDLVELVTQTPPALVEVDGTDMRWAEPAAARTFKDDDKPTTESIECGLLYSRDASGRLSCDQ